MSAGTAWTIKDVPNAAPSDFSQSLPNDSAIALTNVRFWCCKSDQNSASRQMRRSATSRLIGCNMINAKKKTAARRPIRNPIRWFDQAAVAFRFPCLPSRTYAPRPVAKYGGAAGMGQVRTSPL